MTEVEQLMKAVRREAALVDRVMRDDLERMSSNTDDLLIEVLEYGLFNGGKRVRPLLAVLSARLCGVTDDSAYKLASAFEYLHAASLFHDDVIDNAQTRRGRPAVNKKFGLVAAILAGDFLLARSMEIVGEIAGQEGLAIFCQASSGMVDGEFMQLRNTEQFSLSEPDYYDAIMGKTGLLISASCEVGAIYGRGSNVQRDNLKQYGVGLGCAFQMVDDLLDYLGDEKKTGKAVGNDLAEGKMTLPLILALSRADERDRRVLDGILADGKRRSEEFATVHGLIEKYDGFGETSKRAQAHVRDAVERLAIFTDPECSLARETLTGLAGYVLSREK